MSETTSSSFYAPGMMDLSRYRLERADLGPAWDAFVEGSPQGTLFSETRFLEALDGRPAVWWCLRSQEPAAAIALMESSDGRSAILYPNVIHNGIMLRAAPPSQSPAQVMSESFRILAYIATVLPDHYESIRMALHPSLTDMRPFQWHNYHGEGPTYGIDIRYTSLLDLDDYRRRDKLEDIPGYLAANKSRRQEIRYALNKGYRTREAFEPELFLDLYRETFERQNVAIADTGIDDVARILPALHEAGRLRMFIGETPDGIPGAVAVFARDAKRWYYLYGAGNSKVRDGHAGSLVLWNAMAELSEDGPGEIDLEGVNSPQRGYFKLSFGGSLTSYYRVTYPAP